MTLQIEYEASEKLEFEYEAFIRKVVEQALLSEHCPYEVEINVVLTDNDEIRKINHEFRGIDSPTDVLSFPMVKFEVPSDFSYVSKHKEEFFDLEAEELILGDIVISVEKAIEQSNAYGHSIEREIGFLTAHSMLHLFGYDHIEESMRIEMEEKQNNILSSIGLTR